MNRFANYRTRLSGCAGWEGSPASARRSLGAPQSRHLPIKIGSSAAGRSRPTFPRGDDSSAGYARTGALAADRRRAERLEFAWRGIGQPCRRERGRRQVAMGNGCVRRVVARCLGAHRGLAARPPRAGSGRRRHAAGAGHALRRKLAGRQRAGRCEYARHQPRAAATALLSADRPDARARHGMARTVGPADRRRAAACPVSTTASWCPISAPWMGRPRRPARSGRRRRIGPWEDSSSKRTM